MTAQATVTTQQSQPAQLVVVETDEVRRAISPEDIPVVEELCHILARIAARVAAGDQPDLAVGEGENE